MNFRSLASVAALMVLLLASWPAPAAALTFFDHPLSFEDRDPGENLGPYRAPEKPAAEEDKPVIAQPQDTTPNGNKPKEEVKEDPNEEVSVDPDTGKVSVYKPPTVVSSFVNAPTKENAQAYLDWIESKSKKTQTAMNMLTEVVKEKQEAKKKEALKAQEGRDKPEIVTFITPECPHCASQVMALNGLLREGWLGRVEVHAIMKPSRPCAIRTRPILGVLFLASNVYHPPPTWTSNHAAKIRNTIGRRRSHVAQIAPAVTRGNIHAAAKCDGQVRIVAADSTETEMGGFIPWTRNAGRISSQAKSRAASIRPTRPEFRILDHVRPTSKRGGNYWARCPSCAEHGRDRGGDNLAISVSDPRKYKCWAGCTKEMIRAAFLGHPIRVRRLVEYGISAHDAQ